MNVDMSDFHCELCNYTATKKSNMRYHYESNKHKQNEQLSQNKVVSIPANNITQTHEKLLKQKDEYYEQLLKQKDEYYQQLLKQKDDSYKERIDEYKNQIEYLRKTISEKSQNIIIQTSNNVSAADSSVVDYTSFNLKYYLNEICKECPGHKKYVNDMELTDSDSASYIVDKQTAVTSILLREIKNYSNKMELFPIQCVDVKRKTFYIKIDDKWINNTEDDDTPLFRIFDLIFDKLKKNTIKIIMNERDKEKFIKKYEITENEEEHLSLMWNVTTIYATRSLKENVEEYLKKLKSALAEPCKVKKRNIVNDL